VVQGQVGSVYLGSLETLIGIISGSAFARRSGFAVQRTKKAVGASGRAVSGVFFKPFWSPGVLSSLGTNEPSPALADEGFG
jgi:hypothetical protein